MGMGMGIRKYPLPGGDGDGSKVVYPLGLGMGMGMNFYYGDGDGIMIPVPAPPRCHPYSSIITLLLFSLLASSKIIFPFSLRYLFHALSILEFVVTKDSNIYSNESDFIVRSVEKNILYITLWNITLWNFVKVSSNFEIIFMFSIIPSFLKWSCS